jgi:hypothetical protein
MLWLHTRIGRAVTAISALLGMLGLAWLKGRSQANSAHAAQQAKDYKNERKRIDDEISGIGGNDADNIKRLQSIAKRRGAGAD